MTDWTWEALAAQALAAREEIRSRFRTAHYKVAIWKPRECPPHPRWCPAGGEHDWGILEEWGTGRTSPGCENCGLASGDRTYPPTDDEGRWI